MAVKAFNINERYRSGQICVSSELAWSVQQVPGKLRLGTEHIYMNGKKIDTNKVQKLTQHLGRGKERQSGLHRC